MIESQERFFSGARVNVSTTEPATSSVKAICCCAENWALKSSHSPKNEKSGTRPPTSGITRDASSPCKEERNGIRAKMNKAPAMQAHAKNGQETQLTPNG